jgi:hypothetical protein
VINSNPNEDLTNWTLPKSLKLLFRCLTSLTWLSRAPKKVLKSIKLRLSTDIGLIFDSKHPSLWLNSSFLHSVSFKTRGNKARNSEGKMEWKGERPSRRKQSEYSEWNGSLYSRTFPLPFYISGSQHVIDLRNPSCSFYNKK